MKLPTAHEAASLLFTPSTAQCAVPLPQEGGNGCHGIFRNLTAGGLYIIRRVQRDSEIFHYS